MWQNLTTAIEFMEAFTSFTLTFYLILKHKEMPDKTNLTNEEQGYLIKQNEAFVSYPLVFWLVGCPD